MRGGLDDALDKLARRDELRRRAAAEATGTTPAVAELVEAVAAVVARHPELGITMGVEGAGDPVLLHFADDNGVVQVSADKSVAARASQAAAPRHADFDLDLDAVEDPYPVHPTFDADDEVVEAEVPVTGDGGHEFGRRAYRYDAALQYETTGSYEPTAYAGGSHAYESRSPSHEPNRYDPARGTYPARSPRYDNPSYPATPAAPPAATPPAATPPEAARTMPAPLPKPIPLRVEPGETELAAKRLAALLREDPSLLHPAPPD